MTTLDEMLAEIEARAHLNAPFQPAAMDVLTLIAALLEAVKQRDEYAFQVDRAPTHIEDARIAAILRGGKA